MNINDALRHNTYLDDMYMLIHWPDVQAFAEYHWFDSECYPYKTFGINRSYFVPVNRILKAIEPG